ncbi:circadian clock-controlled protein daywake-like isoform X1 [Vanessa atalanta]|uniref:circadian clock-controlled protein daywake-like isoform X1 n=1 Tax=Vanessa atalanta TaxID=42275 RepID=UPI001FCCD58B|nr:circadian clock-controlled protein daywake-like isoform X1 [Vanessa atalanta]
MRAFVCTLIFVIQIALNYGSLPLIQYKCWTWDSACLTARAQALTPIFTAGFHEIGTERLDPMFIDSVNVKDQAGLKFDMQNVYIEGFKTATIDNISIDMNSRIIRLVFHADLSIKSSYRASGYLFSLPIFGHGDFLMRYDNVLTEMVIPFEIIKNTQGKNIINLKVYKYWFDVRGGGQFHLGNLYNNDTISSEGMHAIINQNWQLISMMYGGQMFDKINDNIFNAIRTYLHSQSLENIVLY